MNHHIVKFVSVLTVICLLLNCAVATPGDDGGAAVIRRGLKGGGGGGGSAGSGVPKGGGARGGSGAPKGGGSRGGSGAPKGGGSRGGSGVIIWYPYVIPNPVADPPHNGSPVSRNWRPCLTMVLLFFLF
ncbi:hypothetical protein ACP275_13G128300 [Erythranthe tilingii]